LQRRHPNHQLSLLITAVTIDPVAFSSIRLQLL
jgi:hypothetical protein